MSFRRGKLNAILITGIVLSLSLAGIVYAMDRSDESLHKEQRVVDKPLKGSVNKSVNKQNPPYPDVWGYEFPFSDRFERELQVSVQQASDRDLAVIYLTDNYISKGTFFFSGKQIEEKQAEKYRLRSQVAGNSVGRTELRIGDDISWEQGQACFSCCPEYSKFPITKYSPSRTNEKLSVLYVSEKPIRRRNIVPENCIGKGAWQKPEGEFFNQQVFGTIPLFVPLRDDTFLLYDSHGNFIIRLNKNFISKSNLLNKNVFIVETADIKAIENKLSKSDIFGLQTYNDSVAAYLNAIKAGLQRDGALNRAITFIDQLKEKTRGY